MALKKNKNLLIYLFEGFELFELAAFTDIFGWNNILNKDKINCFTISNKKILKAAWGLEVKVNYSSDDFINLDDFSALIIPGGFGKFSFFEDKNNNFFFDILKHFVNKQKTIVGVCTASIILAETSLFENKKMTTYLLDNKRYFSQLEKLNVAEKYEQIVIDDNLITVSGPKNAIDAAFMLLEKFTNVDNVKKIKYNMMFDVNL